MLRRLAAILVAVTLTTLAGVSPAAAYEGDTYDELIEDRALNDQHAIIIRFYSAVFGRTPDNEGVRFWLEQYDTGEWSTRRIANFFATSDEFKALYGNNTSDAEFVEAVYPNVLGRAPDPAGQRFWGGYLADGNSRAEMILLISNAPEFIEDNWLPFEGCTFSPSVVARADDFLPVLGVRLQIDVAVTDCDFATITSSIEGFSARFDDESTSSPHSPDNPRLPCGFGESRTYTLRAFDSDAVQIGPDFVFSVEADDYEPCLE